MMSTLLRATYSAIGVCNVHGTAKNGKDNEGSGSRKRKGGMKVKEQTDWRDDGAVLSIPTLGSCSSRT